MGKLIYLGSDGYRKYFKMDVRKDSFIHFTNQVPADQIIQSGKLLKNPPYEKMGIEGIQAVSLTYGGFVPTVATNHLKKRIPKLGPIVGIVFETAIKPDVGYVEEVIWKQDVPLNAPKVVSLEEGKTLIGRARERLDDDSMVLYKDDEISKVLKQVGKSNMKTANKKYQHISFVPPESVAKAAERGLEYRKKSGGKGGLSTSQAKKEGVGSGVQRAVNLKNRDTMSPGTIKRMKAFFDRHKNNKSVEPGKKPWEDKGNVAWLLWGGDPGYSWAKKVVKQMDAADKRKKTATNVVLSFLKQAGKSQLAKGKKVEKEHEDAYDAIKNRLDRDMPITKEKFYELIAKAHLREMPDYYTKLLEMEGDHHKKVAIDFSEINSLIQPGRSLTNRELARAIRLAITAEHDAVHLYELVADTTTNTFVRKIMQDVANEEKVHVGEFEKLLSVIDVEDTELVEEGKQEVEEMMVEEDKAPVLIQTPIHTALR